MADRIKGITVQLGGDTTGLSKALKSVNKEISATQSQLKDVDRLLKLDPTNTKLLAQKQRLLSGEIDTTKQKLSSLKEAEKQVQQQFAEGKVSQEQYDALQREIADTEQKLKSLKKEAQDFGSTFKQVMGEAGSKLQNLGSTLTGAGQKMLPVTGAIAGIGAAAVKVGADFDSSMSKVKALSGANEEQFAQLRQAALDAGETTAFSASEAADVGLRPGQQQHHCRPAGRGLQELRRHPARGRAGRGDRDQPAGSPGQSGLERQRSRYGGFGHYARHHCENVRWCY